MRETIKEVLSRTEQVIKEGYTISYNYSIVENNLEGAITASVVYDGVTLGSVNTYDNVTLNDNLRLTREHDHSLIIEQVGIDFNEIFVNLE